jgi:hypothetical protein
MRLGDSRTSREVSMRVSGDEVKMISLGRAGLSVKGDAGGEGAMESFSATGRVVTVYQNERGTGVRTGL